METIKFKANDGTWHDLYDYKVDKGQNLGDLTDVNQAINNLGLRDIFINKDTAYYGKDPSTIHHTMIMQDSDARFVSDRQIMAWNNKMSLSASGKINLVGYGNTVTIKHNAKNIHGQNVEPVFCTYVINENTRGTLGEIWMSWNYTDIIIGNTGSYTGQISWYAFV